jgi:peptide chain release factor 1
MCYLNSIQLISAEASNNALSPALLTRAHLLTAEHAKLADRLGESFDAKTAKRAGELAPIANVLKEWVKAKDVCSANQQSI